MKGVLHLIKDDLSEGVTDRPEHSSMHYARSLIRSVETYLQKWAEFEERYPPESGA